MPRPRPIHAPVTRLASIRAAQRAGADKDRWWHPPGGFDVLCWREERETWRPRWGFGALYWAAQENKLAAVRLLLTSGTDPNDEDEAAMCRGFGSPLDSAFSGMRVGLALLLLAGGTDPIRAFFPAASRPTMIEISSLASSYGRTWQRVSRRATVMVAAVDLVVLAQTRRGAAALPE